MQIRNWAASTIIAISMAAVLAACSGVGTGTNDSTGMTKGEQYEEFAPFLDMMLASSTLQFGAAFWDGVDEEDFLDTPVWMPGLGKVAVSTDTIAISYDEISGWWIVYARVTEDSDSTGTLNLLIDEAIRFEQVDGTPQKEPNEGTTFRVKRSGIIDFSWTFPPELFGTLTMTMSASSNAEVFGLNQPTATATGHTEASFGIDASSESGSGHIALSLEGDLLNVQLPTDQGADACPTSGSLSANFSTDIDVTEDGTQFEASEDWDISAVFTGPGTAHVIVESDDFRIEGDEVLCP